MARMHSRARGKSGSTSPLDKDNVPEWVEAKPKEIEELIVKLANQGFTPSEIGLILRDQYAIPNVRAVTKKKITGILEANDLASDIPIDLLNLIRRSVKLQKHMEENKKDFSAKRGYQLTVSKIRRLVKYYRGTGRLPEKWRYTPEKAALLVK